MATLEEYFAAWERLKGTQGHLSSIAGQLRDLASTLDHPDGVRLNEPTTSSGPPPNRMIVGNESWPQWAVVETAIRSFTSADDEFRRIESSLTPEQRRQTRT